MSICGKCGREPWDGRCNLLPEYNIKDIVESAKNAQTKSNCGHPAIGESPLIIEAAERNKKAAIFQRNLKDKMDYCDELDSQANRKWPY